MTRTNANRTPFALAALAAMATATLAPAASLGDDEQHITTKKLVISSDGPMTASKSHTFLVNVENGEITVTVDGDQLPANRYRADGGRIIILDEDGNEVKSFDVMLGHGDEQLHLQWIGEEPLINIEKIHLGQAPTVMVGVHLDEPHEALLYHLRLDAGQTTMISGLYKDLPAHQAGLDRFDIIVAVDGAQPADPRSILDALADKEPGDEVTFTVIHKGRTKEYAVTLEPFDRERMDPEALIGGNDFTQRFMFPGEGAIEFIPGLPPGDWHELLIDPESRQGFRSIEQFRLPEGFHKELRKELGERIPQDLDKRMETLDERIEELQEMITRLVEQARELAEEAERD